MRSRFNAFSPITERFIFPLWTVSILRICLKNKTKRKEKGVTAKEILTHTNFYQTFTLETEVVTEISKTLKSSQIIKKNSFYFSSHFFKLPLK